VKTLWCKVLVAQESNIFGTKVPCEKMCKKGFQFNETVSGAKSVWCKEVWVKTFCSENSLV